MEGVCVGIAVYQLFCERDWGLGEVGTCAVASSAHTNCDDSTPLRTQPISISRTLSLAHSHSGKRTIVPRNSAKAIPSASVSFSAQLPLVSPTLLPAETQNMYVRSKSKPR